MTTIERPLRHRFNNVEKGLEMEAKSLGVLRPVQPDVGHLTVFTGGQF